MAPASELLSFVANSRVDAMAAIASAGVGCALAWQYLRGRNAANFLPRNTCILVVLLAVLGALIAESARFVIGYPGTGASTTLFAVRMFALGVMTLAAMVLLVTAARLALMRAELRCHAETQQQLREAKSAADEANRAKSEFLAVMSHEIRTPLNAVMGFTNLLAATDLDESQRGYVATIAGEGTRLRSLINDVLDLTKMEKGHLALERLPFAPAETAHEVMRLFSARAAEKKVHLRLEAQLAGPLLVSGDPLRFRQILVNLVDNAIKFTPTGTISLFLSWEPPLGLQSHGLLRVRVCDSGIGIAPEKLHDLFQMFTQADSSTTRRFGGTGLGLAICQRLVRLMDGEISVKSRPSEGSDFAFSLPFTTIASSTESDSAGQVPEFTPEHPPRILVVDDIETNRFLLEVFLRRNGFEPELAGGGAEAVRLAAANRYDAILMDLQMPDVDGYTATQRIRATEPADVHTPIIALTATIARGTREKCIAAGMNGHLTKPLDLPKFKVLLQRFINNANRAPNA